MKRNKRYLTNLPVEHRARQLHFMLQEEVYTSFVHSWAFGNALELMDFEIIVN